MAKALQKRKRESEPAHRALLLFSMQQVGRRSARAAGRAVGRSESTAREWRKRWDWDERSEGKLSEVQGIAVYRALYYQEFKLREVIEVEDRMAAPFMPDTPVPASVAAAVKDAIHPDKRKDKEREREKLNQTRHVALIDGALGYIAQSLQAGEIRASLRDIPLLLRMREELQLALHPSTSSNGVSLIESTRVRYAKETGSDTLIAMHEDSVEITTILGALVAAKQLQAERAEESAAVLEEAQ